MDAQGSRQSDLITLRAIVRGPGSYATPSPDRVKRLVARGLVKKQRGNLQATIKGRVVALMDVAQRALGKD